jgi:DNA-binding transcriptional MerR regulator/methylmalonyl-CoA mutase cobalamin-binding subunit
VAKQSTYAKELTDLKVGFPIRVLAERTGVGASTLRAWERRYNLLTPQRTPKGHRVYTEKDVRIVERILELLHEGHSLPSIAKQKHLRQQPAEGVEPGLNMGGIWREYLQNTLRAIGDFSHERVEAVFNEASSLYPIDMVTERLIEPTLMALGDAWQSNPTGIAEEHFYTSWVRNRLGARFHHGYSQANGARILCACLPGDYHEIGLMLFALAAQSRGYSVLYFGPDLPLGQVPLIVQRSAVKAVILSARAPLSEDQCKDLAALTKSTAVPVMLGGQAGDNPIPVLEAVGGVRLGSRISVALHVLASRVGAHSGAGGWRGLIHVS